MPHVVGLEEVSQADRALAGGKACGLGELVRRGLPVPPGIVVTTEAYQAFVDSSALRELIPSVLGRIDPSKPESFEAASRELLAAFEATDFPPALHQEIASAFERYVADHHVAFSAVRSSATAEDLENASFAGLQDTYLNVAGVDAVLHGVRSCWASLFTTRVLVYRARQGIAHDGLRLAVLVQKMVNSTASGVLFTRDPNTGENRIIVEAGWGLGAPIVGGEITPDHYVVDGASQKIVHKQIAEQTFRLVRDPAGASVREDVPAADRSRPKLSDDSIQRLVSLARLIESHYRRPMDVEWCIEGTLPYIVQARPLTGPAARPSGEGTPTAVGAPAPGPAPGAASPPAGAEETPLLKGLGASPGLVAGRVRRLLRVEETTQLQPGEVLVSPMTTPDMVPAMSRAAAIVTDEGGMTCHAAIVSRELGIPCVVGTRTATRVLSDGQEVSVDGKMGTVYAGRARAERARLPPAAPTGGATADFGVPVTATKIYVNVSVPEKAVEYAQLPVQGVGLLRIEFIFTAHVREHPLSLIRQGRSGELVDRLADGIGQVCRAFFPRPVIVRTSDFKTNEYSGMPGGAGVEPSEENPMIGWRGCSRYISPEFRPAFLLELDAIRKVRTEMGLRNAHLMLPFVRNTWELEQVEEMLREKGLRRSRDFKLYLMSEVPSTVLLARDFSKHCDGFSIGSNDLTQLVLGADRDSETLGRMGYFDERDPAVERAIELLIEGAHAEGRTVGICGQGPSVYPEFAEFLVRAGIDSISLNADTVVTTTRTIAALEQRMKLDGLRKG